MFKKSSRQNIMSPTKKSSRGLKRLGKNKLTRNSKSAHQMLHSSQLSGLEEMQHGLDMTPSARVMKKFNYFYRPYSCEVNVHNYMTFNDDRDKHLLYDLENLVIQ